MIAGTLALLAGVLILYRLPELPNPLWGCLLPLPLAAFWLLPRIRLPAALAAGFLWALIHAALTLTEGLAPELEGRDLTVMGRVVSIPERLEGRERFLFDVESAALGNADQPSPGRVRLAWYEPGRKVAAGERWRLTVRLKRPHGLMNPGGFDYEGWLFQRGIRATGYVRGGGERLAGAPAWSLDSARERLGAAIERTAGGAGGGILRALAVGDRQGIDRERWRVLTATGTNHLVAISGLHVGLVAGLAFLIGRRAWAWPGATVEGLTAPQAGAVAAMIAALGYAALAGFSVPTQRALIMVAVVMGALAARRRASAMRTLALALALVLTADPAAALSPGFWLSFGAVAVLLYGMAGGRGGEPSVWRSWGRAQWLVALGLAPLLLIWFGRVSLVAPVANLAAVPWMSLAVVPLTLAGALLLPLWEAGGAALLRLAGHALEELWPLLEGLADMRWATVHLPSPTLWMTVAALAGVALLLAPRGVPQRWLGGVLVLPLALNGGEPPPEEGAFHFALLDVGQGLATVVRTRHHLLVYDTGPRHGDFDTGWAVVAPYLRHLGVSRIDRLVVSHAANDHAGGADSLLAEIPAGEVTGGIDGAGPCLAGEGWRWDGVAFRVLHPGEGEEGTENDRSCVLQVRAGGGSLLLTGDLEAAGERTLLARWGGGALRSALLQVPHHGSRTSSTPEFVAAVRPAYALFAVGHRNRFGFPRSEVVARYRAAGAVLLLSSTTGALEFRVGAAEGAEISPPRRWREAARRFWHALADGR